MTNTRKPIQVKTFCAIKLVKNFGRFWLLPLTNCCLRNMYAVIDCSLEGLVICIACNPN